MMFGAFTVRVPARGLDSPTGFDPARSRTKPLVTTASVSAANAIRTPQFWLLWVVLFCNVTAGHRHPRAGRADDPGLLPRAATRPPSTAAAAGGFVGLLSLANMAGRFVWSSTSDVIGRKPIYMLYLGGGMVLYLAARADVGSDRDRAVRAARRASSCRFYGGGFATVPAYLRDLFGTFQVGAIHGRLLTAWSAAGVAGPLIVNAFLDAQGTPGELTAGGLPAGAVHHGRRCSPSASSPTC